MYAEAKELLQEEEKHAQEQENMERRRRYEISAELRNESLDLFEIKKRHTSKKKKKKRK